MKKLLAFVLEAACIIGCIGLFAACDNGNKEEPDNSKREKTELLFLIDEGISGRDITSKYKDDFDTMDKYLGNIMDAVEPLTQKYKVSFLIYPNWHYSASGYGDDPAEPLNRISKELKHVLAFFEDTPYKIYLEAYSSGVYTNQNGELGNLPLVPLHYGDTDTVKSLPLDMEALTALLQTYSSLSGVRFHELIGSNIQASNGHGFEVNTETIYTIADVIKKTGKTLVWGDHSWTLAYNDPSQAWWQEVIEQVSATLGTQLILNFNNNSRYLQNSIQFKDIMDDGKYGRRWGLSNQSWFWSEAEVAMGIGWYEDSEIDMPVELAAAFTLEAIERGASLIQFEPVGYFFNCDYPAEMSPDQEGYHEGTPDFSATLKLDKFIEFLLEEDKTVLPSMTVADYYTSSENALEANLEVQQPKKYAQLTLGVFGDDTQYLNLYNADPSKTFEFDTPYFRDRVTDGAEKIMRINLSYNQFDQYLVKKTVNGRVVAQFYSDTNALLKEDVELFADNTEGTFVDAVALNLESRIGFDGDSDEIAVFRRAGNEINVTVYQLQKETSTNARKAFRYVKSEELTALLLEQIGELPAADSFVKIIGLRTRNAILQDKTRPLDTAAIVYEDGGELVFRSSADGSAEERIAKPQSFAGIVVGDINFDNKDEIGLISAGKVDFYAAEGDALYDCGVSIETDVQNIRYVEGFRKTTAYVGF